MLNFHDWLLSEMPIQIQKVGGWGEKDRPYGYRKDDLKIMERGIEKITAKWAKSQEQFNTFICRSSNCFKYIEVGQVDEDFVREKLGLKIVPNPTQPDEIKVDPNAITYIVTNNRGADRIPLTAWTLAHRFGHAIAATGRMSRKPMPAFEYFTNELMRDLRMIIEQAYGENVRFQYGSPADANQARMMQKVCCAIGTMKSARDGTLRNIFEFAYELIAQYIITGKITFNPLPKSIAYYKTDENDYGRRTSRRASLYSRYDYDLESTNEYIEDSLKETVTMNIQTVLSSCVGKIFVM
jgi:hypothetical protein